MAGALSLSRELLLCFDSGFEPDGTEEWKLCLRVQNGGWTLFYISSAGLRQIVNAYKRMNGALTLRHVSDEIRNVLHMTRLEKRLKIED